MRIGVVKISGYAFAIFIAMVIAICWWLTITMAIDFGYSPQTRAAWQKASFGLLLVMWGVMMSAMMLPAAVPLGKLFYRYEVARGGDVIISGLCLTVGFLLPWLIFSAMAAGLQAMASRSGIFAEGAFFAETSWRVAFLLIAGVYQFMPLKFACLRRCQNPAFFLLMRGRRGAWGAAMMGATYGVYCVGCCWALMLLLFVGGVMDWRWIILLAGFAMLEKTGLLPPRPLAYLVGVVLLMLAGAMVWWG